MIECTVDTHILADMIVQYSAAKPNALMSQTEFLSPKILSKINLSIQSHGFEGVIVASAFAFIEIINQIKKVSKGQFDFPKIIGLLQQPPDWFIVEPYNIDTVNKLILVPKYNLSQQGIELADAIHVATALQRGLGTFLATHDGVLSRINYTTLGIFHLL